MVLLVLAAIVLMAMGTYPGLHRCLKLIEVLFSCFTLKPKFDKSKQLPMLSSLYLLLCHEFLDVSYTFF